MQQGRDDDWPAAGVQGRDDDWPFVAATNDLTVCGLIDFTAFEVIQGISGAYILVVWGNDDPRIIPSLIPRIYVRQPDYYEIEVVGCLTGIVPPKDVKGFPLTMGLEHALGRKGIKLIGATKSEQWDLPKG